MQSRQPNKADDPILLKLKECGVDITKATLVEKPENERHVALRNHPRLNPTQADCVAKVLVPVDVGLRADDPRTDEFYTESWKLAYRTHIARRAWKWLLEERPSLNLKKYAKDQPLQDYVNLIERACGAPIGTARAGIEYQQRYISFPEENPDDPNTDCVEVALIAGLEDEDVEISRWKGVE